MEIAAPDGATAKFDLYDTGQSGDKQAADGDALDGDLSIDKEKHQLEIKVQELETLVGFKDAAVEELEKQYNALESRYLALTGER